MKPTVYMSECGYYMIHQYLDCWREFYSCTDGTWQPQDDEVQQGQFTNFNDHDDDAITYKKEWT